MFKDQKLESIGAVQQRNLSPAELIEEAVINQEGQLSDTGALVCSTGKFTGRTPKDRFFVKEQQTEKDIWWGTTNQPIEAHYFDALLEKMKRNLSEKKLYVRDAYLGADEDTRISLRIYNTKAWQNLFCYNMFLRVPAEDRSAFSPHFVILCDPDFEADPAVDGTPHKNFVLVHLSKGIVLVGGTSYAGEMKKGMFTIMNYLLPTKHNVLPMHCSANMDKEGNTAIFFGLSGTGKTTLSADPDRYLIGDDEHGWSSTKVFNFEGGCYAKTIDLERTHEPQIWDAIRFGSIVENACFYPDQRVLNYTDRSVTENTRTAYPIHHIEGAVVPSLGRVPKHIFFLTADAFGVLPPISRLSTAQAMYHFISGYTAKVAGTEAGVTEPQAVFSACFGAPFLPLHPVRYAKMLGEKLSEQNAQVWLINTGWTGGVYGVGKRMSLAHTRRLISAALSGDLDKVTYERHPIFGLELPTSCPDVPPKVLNARSTWADTKAYDAKAMELARAFIENYKAYRTEGDEDILKGGPVA